MDHPQYILDVEDQLRFLQSEIKELCDKGIDSQNAAVISDKASRLQYLAEEREGFIRCEEFVKDLPYVEEQRRGRKKKKPAAP